MIHLDSILEQGKNYILTSLPTARCKDTEKLRELLNTEFTFIGIAEAKSTYGIFKSVKTKEQFKLCTIYFLNDDRFYSDRNKGTALYLITPCTLKRHASMNNETINCKVGTIFSNFFVQDGRYIIETNNGKQYSVPMYTCRIVSDIEVENAKSEKPLDLIVNDEVPEVLKTEPLYKVEIKTTYTVNGIEFSTEKDAQNAVNLLNARV